MIKPLIHESVIKSLSDMIDRSSRIAITCHISPDGDALGSSLGLARVLENLGKDVNVVTPDTFPKNLAFLPGANDVIVASKYPDDAKQVFLQADLIFALDFNDPERIDRLAGAMLESKASKVMIDHHLNPQPFADITISFPHESSTSMLVFRTVCALELFQLVDKAAATCIYTGMMTDTGNFSYNSNEPDLYIVISELLKKGINKDEIYNEVYNSNPANRLLLNSYAISEKMRLFPEHGAALIYLSQKELNRFNYQKGYTEGLVNQPLTISGIVYSFFLREESDHIHVSSRSRGDFPVNEICSKHFNGGGHKNAAGGKLFCSLDEAVEKFISLLDENDAYLK